MEKPYIEVVSEIRLKKLINWRKRYSNHEYPYKVALNLLYELLVVEKMWDEIQDAFKQPKTSNKSNDSLYTLYEVFTPLSLKENKKLFDNFEDALNFVIERSNILARNVIHATVECEFVTRDMIAGFKWSTFKSRINSAQRGDNDQNHEIELAYYFYACAVELIYGWAALGYLGHSKEDSFYILTQMMFGGISYDLLDSVIHHFGQVATLYYKPLLDLFK